jgi:large subunit ribosomal protein L13
MKTFSPKPGDLPERWYLVDAKDKVLGRLASQIASVLRGKQLPSFAPHANMNTHVVVINADKIKLTGKKWTDKTYFWHTQYPGGLRSASARELHAKKPTELLRRAVRGMIPHTRLGRATMTRLRIYAGDNHPHKAQMPEPITLTVRKTKEKE